MYRIVVLLLLVAIPAHASDTVTLVRVDKSERRLELVAGTRVVHTFSIALGGNPVGHKQREGDERTPEGRYVLDWRNPASIAYRSIHISYPNESDRAAAKRLGVSPGGDIMIHGQPNGYGAWSWLLQWFDWTDGCIGLSNKDMAVVWTLTPDGTPIEIAP